MDKAHAAVQVHQRQESDALRHLGRKRAVLTPSPTPPRASPPWVVRRVASRGKQLVVRGSGGRGISRCTATHVLLHT